MICSIYYQISSTQQWTVSQSSLESCNGSRQKMTIRTREGEIISSQIITNSSFLFFFFGPDQFFLLRFSFLQGLNKTAKHPKTAQLVTFSVGEEGKIGMDVLSSSYYASCSFFEPLSKGRLFESCKTHTPTIKKMYESPIQFSKLQTIINIVYQIINI